jgi:hypothetical protein
VKEDVLSVGTALVLTLIVFAFLTNAVMALIDYKYAYSLDSTAYAYASGAYSFNPPSNGYSNQEQQEKITAGNVNRQALTIFAGYDAYGAEVYGWEFYLANNSGVLKIYGYVGIYSIQTYTDSGYGSIEASTVDVNIGPPGSQ